MGARHAGRIVSVTYDQPIRFRGLGNGILRANVGTHSIIVEPRGNHLGGFLLTVDGELVAGPAPRDRLLRQGQAIAQRFAQDDDATLASFENRAEHESTTTAEKEIDMTTTNEQARGRVQSEALRKANAARSATAAAKREEKAAEKAKADRAKARGANRVEILKRHGKNQSISTIATALGISQARVRQILMEAGLHKTTSRNPDRDARIIAAIDAGEDPRVVAAREQVGVSRARWIHKVAKAGAA